MDSYIQNTIQSQEYDFLRNHEKLGNNIILLTLGGSHAYGTNVEGSDIDIRGCALNSKEEILLGKDFEQVIDNNTDTVIYSFHKIIGLLLNCNPNVIEMLGCRPEHYFILSDVGKELIDNRKLFLSKRAARSFGGYADQQLRRLQCALARDAYSQAEKEEHILLSCQSAMHSFHDRFHEIAEGGIRLNIDKSQKEDLDTEIFADISLSHYPLRDFSNILSDLTNIIRDYNKLTGRSHKKDVIHLNKHVTHLLRLYLEGIDIFEKEEIITYRGNERELYLSVRNGEFMNDDGTYRAEFFELVNSLAARFKYAIDNTSLPEEPDRKKVEEIVMDVNEKVVRGV